jgi:hypothetical protein
MRKAKHFLNVRILMRDKKEEHRSIYLIQDAYADKLVKYYDIKTEKMTQTPLSFFCTLAKYDDEMNQKRLLEYRQKVEFICYSATVIRFDIAKTASKLIEFLINSESDHLHAANHCIKYLHDTKFLAIKYFAFDEEELTVTTSKKNDQSDQSKHVFEATVDVFFVNEKERRSAKSYTFKLLDELID